MSLKLKFKSKFPIHENIRTIKSTYLPQSTNEYAYVGLF